MKAPRPESAWPDLLLALGAAALTFAGHDPDEVARRAQSVAGGLRRMRDRLEGLAEQQARAVVGCKRPDACDCLLCTGREAERERAAAERTKERPS